MISTATLTEKVQRLQKSPSNIRNICILAHVDHGKTTLADSLVASNGIISQRQAGKLRYLDDREDEQLRGITMKSSAIALQYITSHNEYLINLIDSPGHVDFSGEVSTGLRLCDGALVVVDALEGVCPQTQAVLQQAWVEGIKPCLVINKVDRLILELNYSPTEAYYHLQQILEQVNAVTGSLFTTEVMEAAATGNKDHSTDKDASTQEGGEEVVYDWSAGLEDTDDSAIYFSPELGNVVFASALDGWGFSVSHFAELYSKKLGIRADVLNKTLWGDYFLNTKSKRIFKGAQAKGKKPLFVQFVLDNIWAVYDAVVVSKNKERIEKIVSSMQLKISARDSRNNDPKVHLAAIFNQWLPLAPALLSMVVAHLPSPEQLSGDRVEKLMCSNARIFDSFPLETQRLRDDFISCNKSVDCPTIIFVSKLFTVDRQTLPVHQVRPLTEVEIAERRQKAREAHQARMAARQEEEEATRENESAPSSTSASRQTSSEEIQDPTIFLAFSRVYSGVIRRGQQLFILQPRYDPSDDIKMVDTAQGLPEHCASFTVGDLYILMGRQVLPVDEVPAGNIVGIAGAEDYIIKSATISSTLACPAFRPMVFAASPIVRVAIEPLNAADMPALVKGMKLLNQADPSVEVYVQETGEHVLATAGEVHLKKCIDDLRKSYAKVDVRVSDPIIPFRETVIPPPKMDMVNEVISSENEITGLSTLQDSREQMTNTTTSHKTQLLNVEAVSLPEDVTKLLETNSQFLKSLALLTSSKREVKLNQETIEKLLELKSSLKSAFESPCHGDTKWENAVDRIWSFGPKHIGPNILLNCVSSYQRSSVWSVLETQSTKCPLRDNDNSIVSGFQLATLSGPLCEEPMRGVCFVLREWNEIELITEDANGQSKRVGLDTKNISKNTGEQNFENSTSVFAPRKKITSGQLISSMKEACRRAFLARPARLMAAMYTCRILATADVLGRLYSVIGRCVGRIISEEMIEGSTVFSVEALIPVAESFGFAEELRKRTSGLASPQLVFSHWEVIPSDPFWVPSTEEELLHFGDKADSDNVARGYMNAVRRRKGLHVDEKIVEHAEKQRTLKKNK
ncbi:elongation factor-like GTPase 1 isoform X2 [Halichondria panicea]|uniref:elongation factor-like GTPase 1 isoform X2 n=1 Tax=Halichondria panicea TaxID=6063 RepID=UPI00312B7BEE